MIFNTILTLLRLKQLAKYNSIISIKNIFQSSHYLQDKFYPVLSDKQTLPTDA